MLSTESIISRLENIQLRGAFYRATCPICLAADSKRGRNLSVRVENGACTCHRCGAKTKDIRAALEGVTVRPIAPIPSPIAIGSNRWNNKRDRHAVAFYEFETPTGVRVQHVKFPKSDTFPKWSWRHRQNGEWLNGMGGNTPYLLNKDDISKANIIFLAEGEKDAGRGKSEFRKAGYGSEFAFTSHHAGAKANLKHHQIEQLAGKIVYIIGDNDKSGRAGVRSKFIQLVNANIDTHTIVLPVLQDGGDLSDAFDDGFTVHDLLIAADLANEPETKPLSLFTDLTHTCGSTFNAFVAIIRSDRTQVSTWKPRKWRVCDACFDERVTRFVMQVQSQQKKHALYWSNWNNSTWKRRRDAWRKQSKRTSAEIFYQSFPQDDGSIVVIHNIEGDQHELMPTEYLEIKVLMNVWAVTPIGKAIGNSRNGFGGQHKGTKGDQSDKARAERQAERTKLLEVVSRSLDNFTPNPTQRDMIDKSTKTIKDLLPFASNNEVLSWLYYEQYAGKKRVTVLKCLLNHIHAIKPDDGLSVHIFGWGRDKVANALNCTLNNDGVGSVEINPLDAVKIIMDSADKCFVRGSGSAINHVMSAFLDTNQNQENTMTESGHRPPEYQQIRAELLI